MAADRKEFPGALPIGADVNTQDLHPVVANRRMRKWSRAELLGRVLWALVQPLFAWSPRLLWGWRRMLLRLFGAKVGRHVHIHPSVRIMIPWNLEIGDYATVGSRAILYALGPIRIGASATVSQNTHLCAGTHDYHDRTMPLVKAPIDIGAEAWICADAFVGPGVSIGARAVVGARAAVFKAVPAGMIVIGNPAKILRNRDEP
jgi:putative colanic acid biosynthesis acetyltransferase WcaF